MKMKKSNEELKDEGRIAADLIVETIKMNKVDFGIAMDALMALYAYGCRDNEIPYKEFCGHLDSAKKGYKKLWSENA